MKFNDIIAYTAIATSIVKMYMDFENSNNIDIKFKNSIIFGIIVTTTWLIYYTNQYGFSVFTMYTVLSLLLQLYVLKNIMVKENNLK
jgi:CDP-diglyceride synthetase